MRRTLLRLANPVSHTSAIPRQPNHQPPSTTTNSSSTTHKHDQASPPTTSRPPKQTAFSKSKRPPPLSLEHFLLRSRVLTLYRTILRAIYRIPDKDARRDPVNHAKNEFARNKNVRETAQIRYLVSTGKAEWDGMRRYIEELALRGKG